MQAGANSLCAEAAKADPAKPSSFAGYYPRGCVQWAAEPAAADAAKTYKT